MRSRPSVNPSAHLQPWREHAWPRRSSPASKAKLKKGQTIPYRSVRIGSHSISIVEFPTFRTLAFGVSCVDLVLVPVGRGAVFIHHHSPNLELDNIRPVDP